MSIDVEKLAKDMIKIVGEKYVLTDRPAMIVYAEDYPPFDPEEHNLPYTVVRPSNVREISQILKYANEKKIAVHVHGSGTSLLFQSRPKEKGIVLDMRRMSKIEVFRESGYFESEPGVLIHEARKVLAQHGAMFPLFPGSETSASVGGTIAVNTSAHGVDAALGKPGDSVLGLEVVLPTGDILETGTEGMRRPAGIELTHWFVGSEGLLGVITKVRMRLIPLLKTTNIVVHYKTVDGILDAVMGMYQQLIPPPMFFEYMDEVTAKGGFAAVGLPEPPGAVALMSVHSFSQAGSQDLAKKFLEFIKTTNPLEARIVTDEDEWWKIWHSRAEAGLFMARQGFYCSCEIAPRIDKLKEAYKDMSALSYNLESCKKYDVKNIGNFAFGHIGASSMHGHMQIRNTQLSNEEKKQIYLEYRGKTEEINVKYKGCGGEWGISALRVPFVKKKWGEPYYELLVKIKKTLDPNNILNRGNLEGWI